ncbi:MAG: 1,4-alpha-glucan branching protein GlgB [Chloroflexota bacterium]|nr:1,4-alpha-glucan branching protein GlgB [Chloroflexota bacterium]
MDVTGRRGRKPADRDRGAATPDATLLTDDDLYLFNEGSHLRLYDHLGAHPMSVGGKAGTHFAVWAPNAERVSVMGDFNGWSKDGPDLRPRGRSGIWEGFVAGVGAGAVYKYRIASRQRGYRVEKADPLAFLAEAPPRTGSVVWDLAYDWGDAAWMAARGARNRLDAPIAIYEVHLGSWRRNMAEGARPLTYRELAAELADYAAEMGFTHVEFLPVMEHPFFGSWGYQTTGYYAPTARYGTPQDLMYLVDTLHQRGIGVIFDWVPSHFPTDEHGLGYFDGTHLYEHADARQGFHPDWKSFIFNYGRPEVRSFLLSNALFWLDRYHADGLRVDAVASMLYLDYSRKPGDWIPNKYGGRENLDAIAFLRRLNEEVYHAHPDVQTYAEESTAWPMVSRPTYVGGLGFGAKWDMGWMHDTLRYMSREPVHRRFHHQELTFRMLYAFNENFVLPLSHDEAVHGKRSLLAKMPGDEWQKHANLRLLFGYLYGQAGKKLLFMGGELAQWREWQHDESLEWHLLEFALHRGAQACVRDLNRLYARERALHELDCDPAGFEWVDASDADNSVITFLRRSHGGDETVLVACNFTPVPRHGYRIGVPQGGFWHELLNTDAEVYGGSGQGNFGGIEAQPVAAHGRPFAISVTLPPLATIVLKAPGDL